LKKIGKREEAQTRKTTRADLNKHKGRNKKQQNEIFCQLKNVTWISYLQFFFVIFDFFLTTVSCRNRNGRERGTMFNQ
jgi:hypothetical protein